MKIGFENRGDRYGTHYVGFGIPSAIIARAGRFVFGAFGCDLRRKDPGFLKDKISE